MKISVIVPVFNVELYIARCLQSVMDQTYAGPMECLLVDDCCTDGSMAVVERMLADYQGPIDFKVLHHERNRGQAAARNTGTDAAAGDYIYYLDSDDAMTPDCLALMVAEVEKHPEVEMVAGAFQVVYESGNGKVVQYSFGTGFVDDNDRIRLLYFKEGFGFSSVVWNKLIKRSFILSNSLRFKEGVIHEDDHWCFYAYKKLRLLSIIGECTYSNYSREGSTMNTTTRLKTAVNMCAIIEDWVNDFDGFGRSLQVYVALELFLRMVYPYVPKKKTRHLYAKFFVELIRMREYKIALCFAVNWFVKWKYSKLSFIMIPDAHREEERRLACMLCR